jgi:alkanesulfonate monooxygenase SsuD/methylene tetrahydromethanopterin reductase-like flavin-dependent oxidoreductase (luciferase family)
MRFGLFGGAAAPRLPDMAASAEGFFDFVETNVEAEALGFHSSFVTEHHFTGIGQLSAPLTLLTFIAARTTRLRLGARSRNGARRTAPPQDRRRHRRRGVSAVSKG